MKDINTLNKLLDNYLRIFELLDIIGPLRDFKLQLRRHLVKVFNSFYQHKMTEGLLNKVKEIMVALAKVQTEDEEVGGRSEGNNLKRKDQKKL